MKTWTLATVAVVAAVATSSVHAETCVSQCVEVYEPVCASDGKTYENECKFEYEKCSTKNDTLTIVSKGQCASSGSSGSSDKSCPVACPTLYDPVCGSNGKTYGSECQLKIASCKDKTITLAHKGVCGSSSGSDDVECRGSSTGCVKIFKPVCGSDGKTYANKCELEVAKCSLSSLTIVSDGQCPDNGSSSGSSTRTEPVTTPTSVPSTTPAATSGATTAFSVAIAVAVAVASAIVM